MANSPFRLEKRFGTTVRKTLPFTAEADGFIILILQGSGQQYAIVSGGRRVNVYGGYEERAVFPVVKGEEIALSSKSSGGSLYVDYMPIEGGVIAKHYLALKRRWRHDFSDEISGERNRIPQNGFPNSKQRFLRFYNRRHTRGRNILVLGYNDFEERNKTCNASKSNEQKRNTSLRCRNVGNRRICLLQGIIIPERGCA